MSERKEMTAVDYLKARGRMTEGCDGGCNKCPLYADKNGTNDNCGKFESEHPAEAVAIVQKWAEEHPAKSMLNDLLEKFPNMKVGEYGVPSICPNVFGYEKETRHWFCSETGGCKQCWNRPLEVEE